MIRLLPLLLALSACGARQPDNATATATVTLPPPKEAAAPGFGPAFSDRTASPD